MAARRGKGGKFAKGRSKKRGKKHHGGVGSAALLHKMDKKLTRIEHVVNPGRTARIKAKRAARHEEESLHSKYG